ncbi:DUF4245 domain-containing protein [Corynebacterium halotolerans]|uniref:DUF4245 domain-containing protein n=1 Tax=Corynebacterium halotolerans TaxID=225326 RepID=UPI003CEA6125
MADEKPRILQGGRDMVLSIGLVVIVTLAVVIPTGLCSWNPGAPEQGPVQEVDAETFAAMEARVMAFPVRLPDSPDGWITNSARRSSVDATPAVVIGWVTADGGFLQLTQTGETLDDAVRGIDEDPRQLDRTINIAGEEVQIHTSEESDVRDLWVVDLGESRALLSGAGTEEEFTTLLEAVITAEPLPAGE